MDGLIHLEGSNEKLGNSDDGILFPVGVSLYQSDLVITPFVAPGYTRDEGPPSYKEGDELDVLLGELHCDFAEVSKDLAELLGEEEELPDECKPKVRSGWEYGLGIDITVKKLGVSAMWMSKSGVFVRLGVRLPID